MTKVIFLVLLAASVSAQTVFQKKLPHFQSAEGLALLPDGGYMLAGLRNNCIQLLRFDAAGAVLWTRQVCPSNPGADITISALQVEADPSAPGAFCLLFRKGAFSSSPDNLLNLMRFDASGNLSWECQLRPEKRYGPLAPGNAMAVVPSGAVWASHAMGFTNGLPDFNQALVFKVSPDGQLLMRRFFLTEMQASANGIAAQNDQEIWVYGGLGTATADGFIIKANETGNIVWAQRYAGMHFLRDGGFFPNGDLLLLAEHNDAFALTRIRPDGTIAWARQLTDSVRISQCAVAADQSVWIAGYRSNGPTSLFRMSADANTVYWGKTFELCTKYRCSALLSLADESLVFAQNALQGGQNATFVKTGPNGQIFAACSAWEASLPNLSPFASVITPLLFSWSEASSPPAEHVFSLGESNVEVHDCCLSEYPEAHIDLPDSVCANALFDLSAHGQGCGDEWLWSIPAALPATSQGPLAQSLQIAAAGKVPVTLIETIGVCRDTIVDTLRVIPPLTANLFPTTDTLLCPDAPFVLQPDLTGMDSWVWEDGSVEATRYFDLPRAGTYYLEAHQGLCAASDTFRVLLGNCGPARIFAPNVFSPNDDALNDVWEVFMQPGLTPLSCQLFDRWGNQCLATDIGQAPKWDGNAHGKAMPNGVYVWSLRYRNALGEEAFMSGDVLLIR